MKKDILKIEVYLTGYLIDKKTPAPIKETGVKDNQSL